MLNALDSQSNDVFLLNFPEDEFGKFSENIEKLGYSILSKENDQLISSLSRNHCKVVLLSLSEENFKDSMDFSMEIQDQFPHANWLVYPNNLDQTKLTRFVSHLDIFGIINNEESLKSILTKAIEDYSGRKEYFNALDSVREQNKKLEVLNKNLENIVHERTLKEFAASQKTSQSLKAIQNILSFVKSMSRTARIDDFIEELRREFKKISGLMPPMLILEKDSGESLFFYFQGKQLIEKKVRKHEEFADLSREPSSKAQTILTQYLGRPVGTLNIEAFQFQAEELQNYGAYLAFENNLGSKNYDQYFSFLKDRWPITNLALENILIKDGMQNIARQWSKTFNEMKDPILILDKKYQMSLSNKDYHKFNGKTCFEAFAQSDKVCKDCPIGSTFQSGSPSQSDIYINDKVYRVHSYPIRLDEQEEVSHVINQYADVTQSINLHSQAIQGEKMAAVGLLAGNIAHELNNPLTGIHSLTGLLMDDLEESSSTYKDMEEIRMAAARCQRIIKDLLEFSNLDSDSKIKKVELNTIVSKTIPLLKMAMRTMNCDLQLSRYEHWVECNPQLLQQVIFNLINNACQAMDDGGTLTVVSGEEDGKYYISIRDTGSGIPEEIKDSIFEPFFTTKSEGKGTGLGLSMSKSVVERAGGQLRLLESNENGTEFQLILPKAKK